MTEPRPNRACLSLGSSIDAERNLREALRLLSHAGSIAAVSSVWESPAEDRPDDPPFLNAAVILETPLSAAELRGALRAIETEMGRLRSSDPFAPRTIDIDIMLFNRDVVAIGNRTIPDDEILRRAFVALPLAEIDPGFVHPVTGETLAAIAARFDAEKWGMRKREISLREPQ
jgi:2-amino-4-hydroxy-6-hydroxymethyldihydropteridine diphosphokinase